jgi:hypothetical protein
MSALIVQSWVRSFDFIPSPLYNPCYHAALAKCLVTLTAILRPDRRAKTPSHR